MAEDSKLKIFNNLCNEIDAAYHDTAVKFGLSDSGMFILYILCNNNDECMLSEVTRLSGMSKQTVGSSLKKLESAGYVKTETVGLRKKKVKLTESGKELSKNTVCKLIEIENRIYNGWEKEEFEIYIGLQRRFLSEFKNEIQKI